MKLPVVDRIHLEISNKFVAVVENKMTGGSKLEDSPHIINSSMIWRKKQYAELLVNDHISEWYLTVLYVNEKSSFLHCFTFSVLLLVCELNFKWKSAELAPRLKFFGFVFVYFFSVLFQYPSLESVHDIKAHATDVDDLDVHPNSRQVKFK